MQVHTSIYWYIPCLWHDIRVNAAAVDGGRGSNVYEVNQWLWLFGRGKPRLGGLSIQQTGERKQVASDALHKRAAETKRARKTA